LLQTAIVKPPSPAHVLGTDNLGRDVYIRIIYGAQASVRAGLMAVSLAASFLGDALRDIFDVRARADVL
jgi:ABC-type dipeptide/oligopeptide/nickel transport system permease subunit